MNVKGGSMKRTVLILAALAFCPGLAAAESVTSPGGLVEITFALGEAGQPLYSVTYGGTPIVADSALGLTLRNGPPLATGFEMLAVTRASHDVPYSLVGSRAKQGRDRCEEMTVALREMGDRARRLTLVFRAYDDAAAFRYVLPEQERLGDVAIASEDTQFRFLEDHRAWVLDLASFTTSNEREFVPMPLLGIKPESIVGPPLTIEMGDGLTVALAEADLVDYAGLHLARREGGNESRHPVLTTKLAPLPSYPGIAVMGHTPMQSPWRVLLMGPRPGALLESTTIWSLAGPSRVEDTSWIRPGRVAWDWWNGPFIPGADFEVGMNDATFEYFIDFAAEFNLEYVLIDAGWYGSHRDLNASILTSVPGMDIPHLVAYGEERGVGLLLWLNWQNLRDVMHEAFALYEEWGVKGVKVDYMNRKDQEMVAFYHGVLEAAARHHLTVDFHGAYAGSGEERTWPNFLTREGVMGLEYDKWSDRVTPRHDVTLPFTRMVLGPMDYTPGGFRNVTIEEFAPRNLAPLVMGTRGHQLAMYVVYESPLQMLVDDPDAYRGQPGAEFLKIVPVVWDETRVLDGAIGEYVVIARRSGDDWFIGAMTDGPRTLQVPLDFLGDGTFEATVWGDTPESAETPTALGVTTDTVDSSRSLTVTLVRGGGAAVHLRR
jgi:alpha-glucosidase